jgi:hypothetical protein
MSKNTNLSFLTDFLTADIVNSRVGMNNVSPQATFDVTGTGKFSGTLTGTSANFSSTTSHTGTASFGAGGPTAIDGSDGKLIIPKIRVYNSAPATQYHDITSAASTNRFIIIPDASGTMALTSDIPANPVGGTGTSGTIPVFTGSTTIGNSIIKSNSTEVNIVGNGSRLLFDSLGSTNDGGIGYTNSFDLLINNSRGSGSAIFLGNINMDFHTNVSGNPRLRITDGGNVLVNTTTDAGYKLDVNGTVRFSGALTGTSATFSTSTNGIVTVNRSSTSFASLFKMSTAGVDNWSMGIPTLSSADWVLFNHATGISNLSFASATGAATFSSSVSATSLRSSTVGTFGFNTASNGEFQIYSTAESGLVMAGRGSSFDMVITNKNGADTIRIPTGTTNVNFVGNVGIGTASPVSKLHVISGLGTVGISLGELGNNQRFQIGQESGYTGNFINSTNIDLKIATTLGGGTGGNIIFYTGVDNVNPERMRINSGGSVGINNASPMNSAWGTDASTKQLSIDASGYAVINLQGSTSRKYSMGVGDGNFFMCYDNTAARHNITVTSAGNVLIGTTSDAGSRLRVSGTLQIDGGFQRMYTYAIGVNPNSTGTITISSPIGTNMQGSMQVMAGGYGNGLTGNITGLWLVGGLLFFDNASTSTITQIVNSVTNFGSMSFQRSGDQYTVTLTNTASSGGDAKSLYVSVIINGL